MARTILLVDDEEDALAVMSTALKRQGYNVAQATNSGDALRLWTENEPAFDLLISDVRLMEPEDGFVLADKLLAARPGIPVIFVSGDRDCFASPAIQRFGDSPFIRKPFDIRRMLTSVADVLSKTYGNAA
jgi:two-component system, cell cycle sensor histidine kinase and response regulator CckA